MDKRTKQVYDVLIHMGFSCESAEEQAKQSDTDLNVWNRISDITGYSRGHGVWSEVSKTDLLNYAWRWATRIYLIARIRQRAIRDEKESMK
jgi:hypothetical protein